MGSQITSTISTAWDFTTKSGGIWDFRAMVDQIPPLRVGIGAPEGKSNAAKNKDTRRASHRRCAAPGRYCRYGVRSQSGVGGIGLSEGRQERETSKCCEFYTGGARRPERGESLHPA